MTNPKDVLDWYERKARKEIRMDKIESYYYMFTRQIKERPNTAGFTLAEYQELVRRLRDWCNKELRGADNEKR